MKILKIPKREEGQGLVEYALVLVLVAIVVIVILTQMASLIVLAFATIIGGFTGQQLSGTGNEGVVVSNDNVQVLAGNNCQLQGGDVSFVLTDDGEIVTEQTVSVVFGFGTKESSRTIDINNSGMGTTSLSALTDGCPATLTVKSWN